MAKHLIMITLAYGLIALCTGCCGTVCRGPLFGRPCPTACGCESDGCGPSCGPSCGPTCGPVRRPIAARRCTESCDSCGECDSGGTCGDCGECNQCCGCIHPLRWLASLFACPTYCGPSCGPRYWGEFYNDPPDWRDPGCGCQSGHPSPGCATCNHGDEYSSHTRRVNRTDANARSEGVAEQSPTLAPPRKTAKKIPDADYQR